MILLHPPALGTLALLRAVAGVAPGVPIGLAFPDQPKLVDGPRRQATFAEAGLVGAENANAHLGFLGG